MMTFDLDRFDCAYILDIERPGYPHLIEIFYDDGKGIIHIFNMCLN